MLRTSKRIVLRWGLVVATALAFTEASNAQSGDDRVVPALANDAKRLKPLVETSMAKAFLDAVQHLPEPSARKIWKHKEENRALSEQAFQQNDATTAESWEAVQLEPMYYYTTRAGSPLIYARPLDLIARYWEQEHAASSDGTNATFRNRRIFDFGYGTIGHLRLLASLGADCTGTEVNPVLPALYSAPGDQGTIKALDGKTPGRLHLQHGRWPADQEVAQAVGEDYDLIVSKNVLKAGYIHPAREVEARFLVELGVDDDQFLTAVFDALKPGGFFLIYNISPAQNPDDQPYIPWADGKSPYSREQFKEHGFVVHAFDQVDQDEIVRWWQALGYDQGQDEEALKQALFAWYTIVQKPRGE